MSANKTLDRWSNRLEDRSQEVRREAVEQLVRIADENAEYRKPAISALTLHVARTNLLDKNDTHYELSHLFRHIEDIEGFVLAESEDLLDTIFNCSVTAEDSSESMMSLLWKLIDTNSINADHPKAPALAKVARRVREQSYDDGQRDALLILDWAEDNSIL